MGRVHFIGGSPRPVAVGRPFHSGFASILRSLLSSALDFPENRDTH